VLGRCFGIALLALGIACWPAPRPAERGSAALHAMRAYNALIAIYLAYLGAAMGMSGVLLWPAVVLHAAVALVLAWPVRGGR
jgi:Ca2+/Na+ antiporter